jgi:hypothetical protein
MNMKSPRSIVLFASTIALFTAGCPLVQQARMSCDTMSMHETHERALIDRPSCYYGVALLEGYARSQGYSQATVDVASDACRRAPSHIVVRDCQLGVRTLRGIALDSASETPAPRREQMDEPTRHGRIVM